MACMSRGNDVSQAASKQSCNGRDGEKLDRKKRKKVYSPRRSNDRSGHAHTCLLIESDILQHIHAMYDTQVGWRSTKKDMIAIFIDAYTAMIDRDMFIHAW